MVWLGCDKLSSFRACLNFIVFLLCFSCSKNDRFQNLHGFAVVLLVFLCSGGVWVGYAPPKNGKECQSGG